MPERTPVKAGDGGARQLHLNAFLMSTGHHEASWRLPESDSFAGTAGGAFPAAGPDRRTRHVRLDLLRRLARAARRRAASAPTARSSPPSCSAPSPP